MKILQNQIKCLKCGDEPFSYYVHNYQPCKCGAVAVDGGLEYRRRSGDLLDYEEMSITVPDKVLRECEEAVAWSEDTGRNATGLVCAIFRVLRDNGYNLTPPYEDE